MNIRKEELFLYFCYFDKSQLIERECRGVKIVENIKKEKKV